MTTTSLGAGRPVRAGTIGHRLLDGWTAATLVLAGLIALPVIVVLGFVFVPTGEVWSHLASTVLPRYVGNSLALMLGVGLGVLTIGTGTAWLCTLCHFPGRRAFEWALLLPLAVPAYVIAYSYTGLLDFAGPIQTTLRATFGWAAGDYWFPHIRSLPGAIVMLTLVLYPYVYLLARAAFLEQSACVLEVSRTLGCTPWRCFLQVAIPLARPAIAAGLALALMETLNDFGAVQHFGVDTFTTGIYRTWLGRGEPAAAAQLAAILMLFIFAVFVLERLSRGRQRYAHTSTRYRPLPRFRLVDGRAALAILACALPILLGFVVPAGALVGWTIDTAGRWLDADFVQFALNSLTLAAIAAALGVVLALVLGYAFRLRPTPAIAAAVRLASMGYAVPGAVIAVGIMLPLAWIDNSVDAWARAHLGLSTGLILSGTIVAVTYAYLVRFLALSYNTVEASLAKITPSMDFAARSLGHGPRETLRRIHAPMIRGSLLTAGILVFVDVMKELPATLVLRPFDFGTLATRTYELASDEQLAAAASSALAIVAVGIGPVFLLSRAIARSRPGHGGY